MPEQPIHTPASPTPTPTPTPQPLVLAAACGEVRYLAWAWKFSEDGSPEDIAEVAFEHRLGIILKTHLGTGWMSTTQDDSPDAVSGPERVRQLSEYFEERGVPFHAYTVVTGIDPIGEARMAAEVLAAGARSIYLDLEPWSGYWQGTTEDAVAFGRELRRLQPNASVVTAIEPRPWALEKLPLDEFASFSDALAPLVYWESFDTEPNLDGFESYGWSPGPDGITPEFLLDVSVGLLKGYNLPIWPVGQGASQDMEAWARFLDHASELGMSDSSVWRFGVTGAAVWDLLKERTPGGPAYVVQQGDTLSAIARRWGVSVESVARANQIDDPNLLRVGQLLCVPSG